MCIGCDHGNKRRSAGCGVWLGKGEAPLSQSVVDFIDTLTAGKIPRRLFCVCSVCQIISSLVFCGLPSKGRRRPQT